MTSHPAYNLRHDRPALSGGRLVSYRSIDVGAIDMAYWLMSEGESTEDWARSAAELASDLVMLADDRSRAATFYFSRVAENLGWEWENTALMECL